MQRLARTGSGFTLVEVLIASLVLTLGFAGNYALITHSLRQHSAGLLRSQAMMIATALADELAVGGALGANPAEQCPDKQPDKCTPLRWRTMAENRWENHTREQLPNATLDLGTGPAATRITIRWRLPAEISSQQLTLDIPHD